MPQLLVANRDRGVTEFLQNVLARWGMADTWQPESVAWSELRNVIKDAAFSKQGAEVVEIGTSWVSGLYGMTALRPFSPSEVARIEREGNFSPVFWKTMTQADDDKVWSIPWAADIRVMYYWSDMFEQANVNPTVAFSDTRNFDTALEQLQAYGIQSPWAAITNQNMITVHHVAMWIWQHGGYFLSPDGRSPMFTEPAAIDGIEAYFNLHRFLPQSDTLLHEEQVHDLFFERKVACILAGAWMFQHPTMSNLPPELRSQLKTALPPAPPFVGGSNLIIMQHLSPRHDASAIDLINHLTSEEFFVEYGPVAGYLLPTRGDIFNKPPFSDNPYMQVFAEALAIGRTFPNAIRWGIVEDELGKAFANIWTTISDHPDQPVRQIIIDQLEPLAKRLTRTLAV